MDPIEPVDPTRPLEPTPGSGSGRSAQPDDGGPAQPRAGTESRTILLIGAVAVAVFGAGLLAGIAIGRSAEDSGAPASSPTASPTSSAVQTLPPAVATPSPGGPPAIGTEGQILAEGSRPVISAPANAPCSALVTPGVLGECGEVPVADNRVVWVVESVPTTTAARASTVRVFTYGTAESGWVEWLRADDPNAERWSGVNVAQRDLTGDGVEELVVGFHGQGEDRALSIDVVSYTEVGLPRVVAHPAEAAHGALVFAAAGFDLYAGRYPAAEPACCPPVFARQSIAFVEGFFRIVDTEDVVPNAVPTSVV